MKATGPEIIPQAVSLQADAAEARKLGIPILLYVSRPDCPYCARLEKEVLNPLIRSGDYEGRMLIREVDWASTSPLTGFQGRAVLPDELVRGYGVAVTPTMVFVSPTGKPLTDLLVGYNGSEYYEFYLNRTLLRATHRLEGTNG